MGQTWHVMSGQVVPAANKSILGIFNGAGSGVVVTIKRIWVRGNESVTAIAGIVDDFSIIRLSDLVIGSGGAVVPVTYDSTNAAIPGQLVMFQTGTATEIATPNLYGRVVRASEEQVTPMVGNWNTWCNHPWLSLALDIGYGDQVNGANQAEGIVLREGEGVHVKNVTGTVGFVEAWIEFDIGAPVASADTYIAAFVGVTWASVNKYIASLLNGSGSGKVLRIKKIWALNNQIAGVTGVLMQAEVKIVSAHAAGTAASILCTDTAGAAVPGQVTAYYASATVTDVENILRFMFSSDEPAVTTATSDELQCIYPLNILYDCYGDAGVQPLTLREGQGVAIKVIWASGAYAGLVDTFVEFTMAAS